MTSWSVVWLLVLFYAIAVTCKKYVLESCTDSEEEQNNENENKKLSKNEEPMKTEESKTVAAVSKEPPTKKKAVQQKTKQATIMNFFKKSCWNIVILPVVLYSTLRCVCFYSHCTILFECQIYRSLRTEG